jgi:hypothetical protein
MTIHLKKDASHPLPAQLSSYIAQQQIAAEPCYCNPLSSLHTDPGREAKPEADLLVLAAPELHNRVRARLQELLPRIDTLSIVLLHVSQVESPPIVPPSQLPPRRQHYHAPAGLLEQMMVNVRRVIRDDDQIVLQPGSGTALLLPHVDSRGAYRVLERIYRSLDLLQAETVIPPLTRETNIMLGSGSYPEQGRTLEQLLYATGVVAHHLILRPALALQRGSTSPAVEEDNTIYEHINETMQVDKVSPPAPFMHLPGVLSQHLKRLIPYQMAQELCCAPVGRDQHRLTVAMADPTNGNALRLLAEHTGMTIFPVSCEEEALQALLTKRW